MQGGFTAAKLLIITHMYAKRKILLLNEQGLLLPLTKLLSMRLTHGGLIPVENTVKRRPRYRRHSVIDLMCVNRRKEKPQLGNWGRRTLIIPLTSALQESLSLMTESH